MNFVLRWGLVLALNSNAFAYVHDVVLAVRRNVATLLPGAPEAFDTLAALYRGSPEAVDLAALVHDATPPVRREVVADLVISPDSHLDAGQVSGPREVPDLVKLVTPTGAFCICFPDFAAGTWVRLPGEIESGLVEQLLRADGRPVRGRDIAVFRECRRPWTKVVWIVNYLAPGGAVRDPLIERCGEPSRRRGQKRSPDPRDERPDDTAFFIRPHHWRIAPEVRIERLNDVEAVVLERFGKPHRRR